MALTNIEYGSIASSKVLNDNFNYLEDKIEDYSKNIASDKASLISLINSQIETVNAQFTTKLQTMYPVGSIYMGVTDTCPIAELFGTWEKVSSGRVLQGTSGSQKAGNTVEAGLPNITATATSTGEGGFSWQGFNVSGAFTKSGTGTYDTAGKGGSCPRVFGFDASKSNSIYGKSNTVQPPAYLVNVWRRTA